jgi:hypothetical protein
MRNCCVDFLEGGHWMVQDFFEETTASNAILIELSSENFKARIH